ncbi:MAG: ice-binding family protein, partial [Acidobacteriota bacterium]|nr:ice-binding family protein [Acidobacteriota bacterium]
MRHTHPSPLNTQILRLIKGWHLWHLMLVAAFVLMASVGFAALFYGRTAAFATPSLGTAQNFAVLAGSTVTNVPAVGTIVTGDLGVWPGNAITGFPPGIVIGTIHAGDAVAMQAHSDLVTAYNSLAGLPCGTNLTGQDLGGLTLAPGVYCFNTSAQLTGILTLDAQGDPNAVFIFQIGSTLVTANNSAVLLINGAQNCNAFWQVGSSATIGIGTAFVGNILAQASISLTTGASLSGRALAIDAAVSLDNNAVAVANCAAPIPPTIGKAFSPATINAGGVSTLTITLSNPNTMPAAMLIAPLTDTLPAGVVIAPVPNALNTCGGMVTATPGGNMVTLTGGSIPGGAPGTCTVTVNVTAAAGGSYINTIPAGALQTSNGNNAAPAVATLTVVPPVGPPLLGKAFNPATITAGGVSTLTITLSNPNAGAATLTAPLTDTLPAGVVIAPIPNASTTCGGGTTVTAIAGGNTVTLPMGRTIPGGAPGTCTVTVDVTAPLAGNYLNTLPAGALQTSNGNNAAPAIATLTVVQPPPTAPVLGKAFNPATINAGGVSQLTITLSNPNVTPATLTAPLIDTLPAGVVIAPVPNAANTCGGVATATAGGSTVTLTGGAIPGGVPGTCTVTVNVTAALGGSYINTIPAGALQTSNGNNPAPAIATLTVIPPGPAAPLLSKAFNPATINAGGVSTLTITLSNPNAGAATLSMPLTDTLPPGVLIAPAPNASTTCGGGVVTANAGTNMVTLAMGAIIPGGAPGTCTVVVNVTAALAGNYINTIAAGALQTNNGNNASPAIATLTVIAIPLIPPTLSKAFNPATINTGGVSQLTITLSNPNTTVANLTAPLTDTLPNGVLIAAVPNAVTTCLGSGAVTATAGGSTVTLPVTRSIPAGNGIIAGTCTVTVNVTAALPGSYLNILPIGALQTNKGFNLAAAIDTLIVDGVDLCIIKTGSAPVAYETTQFTYTLSVVSFGPGAATGVAVTDILPAGVTLVSATPSQGTCSGTSTITCNLGNLAAQATATITLVVRLPMKSAGTVLCNTATIISNQTEIAPANNTSTLCVPVEKVPPGPGPNLPPTSQISDQKSGSVLIFPFYT